MRHEQTDEPKSALVNNSTPAPKAAGDVAAVDAAIRDKRTAAGYSPDGKDPARDARRVTAPSPSRLTDEEVERREQEQAQYERHREQAERRKHWSDVIRARGTRYGKCTLDNFECSNQAQRDVVQKLRAFAEKLGDRITAGENVILYGPPGTGKDHLIAALLARAAIDVGSRVAWINGGDLYGEFRDAIGESRSELSIIRKYTTPDVLAISDPVTPRGDLTDFQSAMLFRIIDGRYSNGRATLISINVKDGTEASTRIGSQVIDRLTHGGLCLFCNWKSYRKAKEGDAISLGVKHESSN